MTTPQKKTNLYEELATIIDASTETPETILGTLALLQRDFLESIE